MVLDIKLCRFENVPWGFRLVGGADFEIPLTVIKVTEGSIAEEAGLRVGDEIVRINDIAASPLVHDEAHSIIMHCGNVFYFGVHRENEEEANATKQFPMIELERPGTPDSFPDVGSSKTYSDDMRGPEEYLIDLADRPNSVSSQQSETKLVDQEIAAVMSGESEMLKEHNIMGIFPKPGVCMSSDVLRTLNEDATKTKAEKDKENKKWTTFLQKPNRPIPRSKAQIEAERRAANAYKVKIVKSAPRSASPVVQRAVEAEPVPEPEPIREPTPPSSRASVVEEAPPTDSEVPNLEETSSNNNGEERQREDEDNNEPGQQDEEKSDQEKEEETSPENTETINMINTAGEIGRNSKDTVTDTISVNPEAERQIEKERQKTPEERALERQLSEVQKQLQALSSLPSTIQATLDAVTKQLGELLPTFKLQPVQLPKVEVPKVEIRQINLERIEESKEEKDEEEMKRATTELSGDEEDDNRNIENGQVEKMDFEKVRRDEEVDYNLTRDMDDYYEEASQDPDKQKQILKGQEETRQMEEELNLKKKKRHEVIEELEEHLDRKNKPKQQQPLQQRSKRAFGPLTPSSERPLVLPGGRRWYRPKDAYNDEFIAETLSAQAELITGTTLGVNFMKYQKPEKKIDLDRSEVYKIIHHLDRKPVRGIEVRAPVVPAAVDIRKAAEM